MFIELEDTKNLLNLMYICDCTSEDNIVTYTMANGSVIKEVLSDSTKASNRVIEVKTKQTGGGGSQPTGTINITENGLQNVSQYAKANVNVPQLDTSDATAAKINIRVSKTAYVNGQKITGSLPVITYPVNPVNPKDWNYQFIAGDSAFNTVRDGVNYLVGSYQIAAENQPDSWMFEGNRKMKLGIPFSIVSSTLGVTANKIKKGETIAGVTGTYEGVQPNLQDKSETIATNTTTTIQADNGYDGLGTVTVTTDVILKVPDGMRFGYSSVLPNKMDTSECTNLSNFFYGCGTVTTLPVIDTSNATRMDGMFRQCTSLREVPSMVTNNVTRMDAMFRDCSSLRDIPALNANSVTIMQSMFMNCNQLTDESLNNILYLCTTVGAAYTRPKTLSELGLSQAQATTCQTLSNWDAFVTAGWTTGY